MTSADTDNWGPLSSLPGNALMWVLILSEMLVFSAFFLLFSWQRAVDTALFDASQQLLDPLVGGLNTMVLLTSGLLAAFAVEAMVNDGPRRARQWLSMTAILGIVFCVVKIYEYASKLDANLTPETNTFFSYYYLLTGFHFAHVLFGLGLLALACRYTTYANVVTVTAFWHMVDLIWVLLYPLIYLLR